MVNNYTKSFQFLEGRLWAHPRTQRIYQIATVFFHSSTKRITTAYSSVMDVGPQGKYDQIPSRIVGKKGLMDLVQEFENSCGSQEFSRNKWPQLATSDYGTSLGKRGLYEFYVEVLRVSDKERQSFKFKRTIITANEESSEETDFPVDSVEL